MKRSIVAASGAAVGVAAIAALWLTTEGGGLWLAGPALSATPGTSAGFPVPSSAPLAVAPATPDIPIAFACPARGPFSARGPFYSQFYEDYILSYVFADVASGTYVDVGANDPDAMTVTKHFYLKGWRGVNIEPNPDHRLKLQKSRPDDENIEVGISDGPASLQFYRFDPPAHGLSTFDREIAERHGRAGFKYDELVIPVTTLTDVLRRSRRIDAGFSFLNIDVEGFERKVLDGLDFARFPPTVVVIEATAPLTEAETQQNWESVLFRAGYVFALDDGLNRYYVQPSRPDLLRRFLEANYCVGRDKIDKRIKLDGFWETPNR
jgi:FkbM family methyltransferase